LKVAGAHLEAKRPLIKRFDLRIQRHKKYQVKGDGQQVDDMKQEKKDVTSSACIESRQFGQIRARKIRPSGQSAKYFPKNMSETHRTHGFGNSERNHSTFIKQFHARNVCALVADS
jgi:hypothetical protein